MEDDAGHAPKILFGNMTLEEIERLAVLDTLENVGGGNKSEAARRLDINRKTLLSKL